MDIGSLHPDEISPLDTLQEILTPTSAQLHKQREVWGPYPETLIKRSMEKARNEALACMTSLEEVSEKSLFEIAMLRAVLGGGMEGIVFERAFKPSFHYFKAVAPSLMQGQMTNNRLWQIYDLFVAAREQLLKDKRIAEHGGKLYPTNESAPWFEKWRSRWSAAPFSEPPSEAEQRLFSNVAESFKRMIPKFKEGALVRHAKDGIGRIKKMFEDGSVLVRFRRGGYEYCCLKKDLELV